MAQQMQVVNSKPSYWAEPKPTEARTREFTTGLCDCFADCGTLVYAHFCIVCLISENSARLDNNPNTCGCCYPGGPLKNRLQAKAQFGVAPGCDACTVWAFSCCSEMQVKRELDYHRNGRANTQSVSVQPIQYIQQPQQQQAVARVPMQQTMY